MKHWYEECLQQAKLDAAPITGSTESQRVFQAHQYKTCCYTRCPCKYAYAGTKNHKVLMYNDTEGANFPRRLDQYMQSELGLQRVNIPDCLVVNVYGEEHYIKWHTDDDPLFDTQNREVEILSISLGADGVFCVQPQPHSVAANAMNIKGKKSSARIMERDLRFAMLLSHGSAVLMTGWFQTEFQHCTIPSTEWSNHAWASTVTRSAKKFPTNEEPRINLTYRYIVNHNCPQRTLEVKNLHPVQDEAPFWPAGFWPAASAAAALAAAKDGKTLGLEQKVATLQQKNDAQTDRIATMHIEIINLEDALNRKEEETRALNQMLGLLQVEYEKVLNNRGSVALELYWTQQQLAHEQNINWEQYAKMMALQEEIKKLRYEATIVNVNDAASSGAPPNASEKKQQKLTTEENKQRVRELTANNGCYVGKYKYNTAERLHCLGTALHLTTFGKDDHLFKGFQKRGPMHRILIALEHLQDVFDGALELKNNLSEIKNCHMDCPVSVFKNFNTWHLTHGVANRDTFVFTKDNLPFCVVAIELRLDFDQGADRFILQEPTTYGSEHKVVFRKYVHNLKELLSTEKQNQYSDYKENKEVLPTLPGSWGEIDNVGRLPCVIWIKPGDSS